jgi:hypothetical protein
LRGGQSLPAAHSFRLKESHFRRNRFIRCLLSIRGAQNFKEFSGSFASGRERNG